MPNSPRQPGASVLIVDDHRINRAILEINLTQKGYRTTTAINGREALAHFSGAPVQPGFDAVILDIMMPDVDGLAVLAELRKHYSPIQLPIIMATARDQSEDFVLALKLGANDYVTKPIDIPVLFARLETQIDLKRSHAALRDAQQSLIEIAKMETVGMLAAGVAHEIRNPLARILMAAEGLANLDAVKNDENGAIYAQVMTEAVESADAIIRRLMEFSNAMKLTFREGHLNSLVLEVLDILADDLRGQKIELQLSLDDTLPAMPLAAPELLQVLVHLIMNSIQAMPSGGKLSIETGIRLIDGVAINEGARSGIKLRNGSEAALIEITDNGKGIAPDHLEKIFDAFFTTRATGTGTGLGLTVVRKMIHLHGGSIQIVNRLDSPGVCATILLPLRQESAMV